MLTRGRRRRRESRPVLDGPKSIVVSSIPKRSKKRRSGSRSVWTASSFFVCSRKRKFRNSQIVRESSEVRATHLFLLPRPVAKGMNMKFLLWHRVANITGTTPPLPLRQSSALPMKLVYLRVSMLRDVRSRRASGRPVARRGCGQFTGLLT